MMFNTKKLFLTTAVALALSSQAFAADIINFHNLASPSSTLNSQSMASIMSEGNSFKQKQAVTLPNKVKKIRLQQYFHGVPVYNYSVAVTADLLQNFSNPIGFAANNINPDPHFTTPTLTATQALAKAKSVHFSDNKLPTDTKTQNDDTKLYVYLDGNNQEHLVYMVNYLVNANSQNSRPYAIIDAHTGTILKQWEGLTTLSMGTGPGGNEKVGQYEYGSGKLPKLNVMPDGKGKCAMDSSFVKTEDARDGFPSQTTKAYSFDCSKSYRNTEKEANGGFSPINDAQYNGTMIYSMYRDWFSMNVLPFKLIMAPHDNTFPGPDNAWWDGKVMHFGDGHDSFYPLVSIDVGGHEISHGFTELNSGLEYWGQSGAMNESFSDMAGEAAKNYARGTNDFLVGLDITKNYGALRYMKTPPLDGYSIDNEDNYTGQEMHSASGIYNKVFYLLATTKGWTTKKAFAAFVYANVLYWTPESTFDSGACGVEDSAKDLHFKSTDVVNAFAQVGVKCKS
ncbi:peptidase M4 family protein [Parashewanella curva]|uniref:Neutral metalloproteinase n=1 Tax=Parashewanella curva TaxID=2338552 RepID=A0A3L8PWE0_9GAMM|nr:M4 family metallopeptidase [Parashewanella curva]RLV59684.1 peptidase M4 family protein [Parashewanella curva]